MKKFLLIILAVYPLQQLPAQITDNIDGRLYLLCKTWGYVKYFNQNPCGVAWDELLNNAINNVLVTQSNWEFNDDILKFLDRAGSNQVVPNPAALPDTNLLVNTDWIDDPVYNAQVRNRLKLFRSNIHPDRHMCLAFREYGGESCINFSLDQFTIPIDYTIESHRLAVFFYYWNVINYFFPYRNLMDQPWDSTLIEFLPVFRLAKDELEFHQQFLKLAARINDSHGFTHSSVLDANFWRGSYCPRIAFARIEGRCVVRKTGANDGIEPGDILTVIDGIAIKTIEDSLALYTHASTPAALYRNLYKKMIRGGENTSVEFTFINKKGQTYIISKKRDTYMYTWEDWIKGNSMQESYKITACGYGYVDMGKLIISEVPEMYDVLKTTPAIIFDLRNFPNYTWRSLAPYFFNAPFISSVYYDPALNSPQLTNTREYLPGWYFIRDDSQFAGGWGNPSPYSGKVIILVNEVTQSQAELTCQYLSYHPNAKVIGTQTAGTGGNISTLGLPGGLWTSFSSLGWYYADGYQQQRNGVKIDSVVAPTIQGIREGKDEILLAALDCISGIDNPPINPLEVTVYPNPVSSGSVQVSFTLDQQSEVTISLMDLTGKTILFVKQLCSAGEQTIELDLYGTGHGFYMLKTQHKSASSITKLLIQ